MTLNGWILILLYCGIIMLIVKPLGYYMTRVYTGERTLLLARAATAGATCSTARRAPAKREDQHWTSYTAAMLFFNLVGCILLYALLRLQGVLPFNPAGMGAVGPELAFNTATSFVTNTNWQNYGGESTMSYLTQMTGLSVQNFLSAATGMAIAVALIRGFARASARSIGNFWVDVTRSDSLHPAARLHRADAGLCGARRAADAGRHYSGHNAGR